MSRLRSAIVGVFLGAGFASATLAKPTIDYVDPFIGTTGYGFVYPGATLPFGFIQVGPDTRSRPEKGGFTGAGGYNFSNKIDGFSQQHISGMGGPLYGHISVFPMTGTLENPAHIISSAKSAETASPGYYSVTMAPWDVKVELTATRHVALHRHTFPAHDTARILVDVGHVLYGTGIGWSSAKPTGGEVHVDAAKQEVSGFMVYQGARSSQRQWKVYFSARFDIPFADFGTWDDSAALNQGVAHGSGKEIGAYLNFKTTAGQVINTKIAVSYKGIEQARAYIATQTPGWNFDQIRQAARAEWQQALNKITVEGGSEDQKIQFYTALYRVHVTPNDWTGEAPERYGEQTYYENILCMWDTFRTVNPLLTLIQPKVQTDIVNSIINYYVKDGWTGDAHSAWNYEHVQNGSHADVIIADAYVKKLPGIDWKLAYEAIRKNAFVDDNPDANGRPNKGRYRLNDYRKYQYLPTDASPTYKDVQGVSRTVEYVYNDFAVLTLAKEFGTPEDIADLQARQFWYKNQWDPSVGFMRGRTKDGRWHEPFNASKVETGRQYYEGHAWTWSWFVPHDNQGLINLMGGNQAFVDKLSIANDNYYEAYNEPGMLQTFLFNHAGRPDKTQFYVRKALKNFSSKTDGLPGNDDSGTTSAWLIWAMLGIYPNAGQDYYYIGSPTFIKATIRLANGRDIIINSPASTEDNKYISQASLNGKRWTKSWVRHADMINGAQFDFSMSAKASQWGAKEAPPSVSAPASVNK